ncbi:MAG: inositol monophosphatase family protein [Candidatus Micrarchaeia archaeon]
MATYLNDAVHCARLAGNFLKEMFAGNELSVEQKGRHDFVTSADKGAEEIIVEYLTETYPEHTIISEERGMIEKKNSKYTWYVDPLDGTTNFIHHIPYFNTSIALEENGVLLCGAVYNPILDEVFYAERGGGAFLNGSKISPSKNNMLEKAFIGICHGRSDEEISAFLKIMGELKYMVGDIRKLGSAALEICYTASGRIDAFIGYGVKPWDFKAGLIVGLESGCKAGGVRKEMIEKDAIMIASPNIYNDIRSILNKVVQ